MRCAADAWAEAARYATGASEKRRNENSGTKATGAAAVWGSKERKYPCTSTVIKTTSKKLKTKGNVWKYERSDTAPFFCRGIPGTLPVPVFCLFSPPFKGYGKLHSTLPQPLNGYRYTASNPGLCVNPKGFPQSFFVRPFLKK